MTTEEAGAQGAAAPAPPVGAVLATPSPPGRAGWRGRARWLLGAVLVVDLGLLLFVLSFANVTAEGPAKRSLRHSIAILTEVDRFLDDHFAALQEEAARTEEPSLSLADFPVRVSFTPEDVVEADREQFRALLLTRAAERVYEEGASAWREEREAEANFFSTQGAVRNGIDFLRATPHDILATLTVALAALAAVVALGLALASRGYGRLVGLGTSALLAALPFLILAIAVRYALRQAADGLDDYLAREFLELGQELTWAAIRNGIIVSVGGAVVLAGGAALARWSDARGRA